MTERPQADTLVVSRRLITIDGADEGRYEGVVISGDRIERLIARDEVEAWTGEGTTVVDCGDKPVMPGFVDVHAHVEVAARAAYGTIDCRAPECSTVADVQEVLREQARSTEDGEWIVGQANLFFDRKLREGRLPTREELDEISRRHPIALRAGGHITVLNTAALERAGIDAGYRPPDHSVTGLPTVVRDGAGAPTGVVKEMDNLLPFPPIEGDGVRAALRDGIRTMFTRYGVTTAGEISETVEGLRAMDAMAGDGELDMRMRIYLWAPGTVSLDQACDHEREIPFSSHPDVLRIQGVKLFSDGGFSARSAAVTCPYHGENGHRGDIALTPDGVAEALRRTREAGLQLAVHANGDRAQEWLCRIVAEQGGGGAGALRTRIEHAGNLVPSPGLVDWWARSGIVPVPQPVFLYTFGGYFPDYLGEHGVHGRFPFRSLLAEGWTLSGSSDVWIGSEREATNPLFSVWCCVARETYDGGHIDEHEAITVDQALRMHTLDAASVLGEAEVKGSLSPGKLADLIVLDRDPRTVATDDLRGIKVERVFMGGREVTVAAGERA